MKSFSIEKIVKHYKEEESAIAKVLFPKSKYPICSYKRLLSGKSCIKTNQLEALASYLGATVSELYSLGDWGHIDKYDMSYISFVKGRYRVAIDQLGKGFVIYSDGVRIYSETYDFTCDNLSNFIKYIESIIKNYENGNFKN